MIYTVTFNPSLDYFVTVPDFALGKTNRTASEQTVPGGKGLNVSIVLKNLGIESTCLGFIAGYVGDEILRRFLALSIPCDFIRLPNGCSRINVKLKNYDGTEINGAGPVITSDELEAFYACLDALQDNDTLVLAGSIPSGMPASTYRDILKKLSCKKIYTVVDAADKLLAEVLPYHPFLIKPNNHELGAFFGVSLHHRCDVIPYAKKLQEMGARNVLVSLGKEGAVCAAEDGHIYESPAPDGKLINAVGAGDSMVAGFLAGFLENGNYGHAFKKALAAGSASAFSDTFATKEEIAALYRTLEVL